MNKIKLNSGLEIEVIYKEDNETTLKGGSLEFTIPMKLPVEEIKRDKPFMAFLEDSFSNDGLGFFDLLKEQK